MVSFIVHSTYYLIKYTIGSPGCSHFVLVRFRVCLLTSRQLQRSTSLLLNFES